MSKLERVCAWGECGVVFTPAKHNQIYHTDECCKRATNARLMERYYEDKARMNGAERVCKTPHCGTFLSRYNESKFCAKCEAAAEVGRTKTVLDAIL